jgi:hypothetical protein
MSASKCNQWHCLGHGLRAGIVIAVIMAVVMTAILIVVLAWRAIVRDREFAPSHDDRDLEDAPSRRQSVLLENAAWELLGRLAAWLFDIPGTTPPTSLQSESRSDLTVTPRQRLSMEPDPPPLDYTLFTTSTPTESWVAPEESGAPNSNLRQTTEEHDTEASTYATLRSSHRPTIDQADLQSFSSTISQVSSSMMEADVAESSHVATQPPEGYNPDSWYIRRKRITRAQVQRWAEEEAAVEIRSYPRDRYAES